MSGNELTPVARAVAGDPDALMSLLTQYGPGLAAHLRAAFPQRHQAAIGIDDLLQDIAAEAFLSIRSATVHEPGQFFAWLRTLADRRIRDVIRYLEAAKRGGGPQPARNDPLASSQALLVELLEASTPTASLALRRDEALAALRRALDRLPDDQRLAVQLYRLDGRPIEEIAQILDRSPGAVHLLCSRAQQGLFEPLAPHRSVFQSLA